MNVISIINNKGGVGKTTTTASLSYAISNLNKKVLMIDLDGQANLTNSIGLKDFDKSIYNNIKGDENLSIYNLGKNIDIVPASIDLHAAETEMANEPGRELIIKELIDPIKNNYDYIIIDCPPSLGLLTINALVVSDKIIIPVEAEPLALSGMQKILEIYQKVKKRLNNSIDILGILITKFDKRKVINRSVKDIISENYEEYIFNTTIRDNVTLAEAPASGKSILDYDPKSKGAEDYIKLAKEVIKRTK